MKHTRRHMISLGALSGVAKVAAIGGLMAAAAGGIYFVASTQGDGDDATSVQVAETSTALAAPEQSATPPIQAQTPTDSLTEPPQTPTAVSSERMRFGALVWWNARPPQPGVTVEAFVGATKCAESITLTFPDGWDTMVIMEVPAESDRAGCGTAGSSVRFTVDGRDANGTIAWRPGDQDDVPDIVVGPPFARYTGTFTLDPLPPGQDVEVQPTIDGNVCGRQLNALRGGPEYGYVVVVDPEELVPGCGRPGAVVTFRLISRDETTGVFTGVLFDLPGTEVWVTGGEVQRGSAP